MTHWKDRAEIGDAVLYRGDALRILPALPDLHPQFGLLLTDPPYSSGGAFRGDRAAPTGRKYQQSELRDKYRDFGGDNRDQRGYLAWTTLWLGLALDCLDPGALVALFTDWRQLPTTTDALQAAGFVWRGIVPWDKTEACRPILGRYRSQAEYVVWGTVGARALEGRVGPGCLRCPASAGQEKSHQASKPWSIMAELLTPLATGAAVLDPFAGHGPIGEACIALGHPYVACEQDPHHFAALCARLERVAAQQRLALPDPAEQGLLFG
jgi:site-specific DNA-methyltransferase (adenine-specific)